MPLSRLYDFVAEEPIRSAEIDAELDQLVAAVNAGAAADTTWRTIYLGAARGPLGTGIHYQTAEATLYPASSSSTWMPDEIRILAADHTLSGETPMLRLSAQCLTNGTAPGVTFVVGLHAITASGGGAGVLDPTVNGTAVTDSTATLTTPGADLRTPAVSSAFALPSDGYYVVAVTPSGASAANSAYGFGYQLQVKVAA